MRTAYATVPSPVGPLLLTATAAGLTRVWFAEVKGRPAAADPAWVPEAEAPPEAAAVLAAARRQLAEYFAGARRAFDLPLAPEGTAFQRRVWAELCALGHGETASYGELARRLGAPGAARAVGAANGRNPLAVVVPCHRVVGAGGALAGFAGGVARKRWLLAHEGALGPALAPASP